MRRRGLSDLDRASWASYARLVSPLPGVAVPPMPPVAVPLPRPEPSVPVAPMVRAPLPRPIARPVAVGDTPGGVDRATWTRFRTGKLPVVRTLDLHGRTAQLAYAALEQFLRGASAEGVRCVEVITGRGKGEIGVIRREFPLWLNQPHLRPMILGAAHPHALNPGSVRLLLRRNRSG